MKRRHPAQIMNAADLIVGEVYALVTRWEDGTTDLFEQHCLAVVADTERLLRKRGRWHGQANGNEEYTLADLMDADSAIDATRIILAAVKGLGTWITPFTVHLDGWVPDEPKKSEPMLLDWCDAKRDYGVECAYPFDKDNMDSHTVIVPAAAWLADPRFHVLNWANLGDVVKPLMRTTRILGDDLAADKRMDDNLRRIFG